MSRRPRSGLSNLPSGRDSPPSQRMGLLCRLGCHEAEAGGAFQGAAFHSHCRGCGAPMVRRGACWSLAQSGFSRAR